MKQKYNVNAEKLGIHVVNLAEAPTSNTNNNLGCGCATMSRNDPPHLVALLDLLRQGKAMEYNEVKAGDSVNEFTGTRGRLSHQDQAWVIKNAKTALQNMISITEA